MQGTYLIVSLGTTLSADSKHTEDTTIATSSRPIGILAVSLLAILIVNTATVQASNVAVTTTISAERSSSVITSLAPELSVAVVVMFSSKRL